MVIERRWTIETKTICASLFTKIYMHAFIIKSLYWFAVVTRKTELLYMQKSYNFMNTILVQVESLSYFFNFLTHF